ncbi:MAG: prolipoprotein diacylglyceryl transferase [Bacillota bacterium]
MSPFPQISPIAFKLGAYSVPWYGIMYAFGITASYLLVQQQLKRKKIPSEMLDIDILFLYLVFGLILGSRAVYLNVDRFLNYLHNPLKIFAVWDGGMSFHGGLIGVVLAILILTKKNKFDFFKLSDIVAVTVPIGLGLGRIGDFINGELYGRVTLAPWGMVFPSGGPLPRHPSQLYEFILEGIVLFAILWFYKSRDQKPGTITAVFLTLYGSFGIAAEYFREPGIQLVPVPGPFTTGQILDMMMILFGLGVYLYTRKNIS